MNKLLILSFAVILTTYCVAGKDVGAERKDVGAEHDITTDGPDTTTTTKPTTKSTSTTSTTTTTTTTMSPNTTTTTTTTMSPNTTSSTSTSTTPSTTSTSTTTVAPIPTTPAPLPPAPSEPSEGTWSFKPKDSNSSCIIVHFAMQLQIPYMHSSKKLVNASVDIPENASVSDGDCVAANTNFIVLKWLNNDNKTDQVKISFWKNESKYYLNQMEFMIELDDKDFPGAIDTKPIKITYDHPEFETSVNKSYKCDKKESFNFTFPSNQTGEIFISHLQVQAFGISKDDSFYSAEDCAPFDTPDIVPIAVGCALAALVIIVLIAYLIGRRRRQARGYLSM